MKLFLANLVIILFTFLILSDALKPSHHQSRRSHRKSHKRGGNQLYGVSLSSINGFEKPMIPPNIMHFDMPINYDHPPVSDNSFTLDLPSKVDLFINNTTNNDFPPFLQQ